MDNWIEPEWRSSSKSSGGACVEIREDGDRVLVRDSKDRSGDILAFDVDAFRAFIADLKDDDLSPGDEEARVSP